MMKRRQYPSPWMDEIIDVPPSLQESHLILYVANNDNLVTSAKLSDDAIIDEVTNNNNMEEMKMRMN